MQQINETTVAETVERLTSAFNEINTPVATEQQMQENLDMLGLPVPMHEALARNGMPMRGTGIHGAGVDTLMHISHAYVSAPQVTSCKVISRWVRSHTSLFSHFDLLIDQRGVIFENSSALI